MSVKRMWGIDFICGARIFFDMRVYSVGMRIFAMMIRPDMPKSDSVTRRSFQSFVAHTADFAWAEEKNELHGRMPDARSRHCHSHILLRLQT